MVLSTPPLLPPTRPRTDVESQIIVIEGDPTTPILIEPGDEVTSIVGQRLNFPDEILAMLSDPKHGWVDVWQDGINTDGHRTLLRRRVFARNVTTLLEAVVFPLEENMVQA